MWARIFSNAIMKGSGLYDYAIEEPRVELSYLWHGVGKGSAYLETFIALPILWWVWGIHKSHKLETPLYPKLPQYETIKMVWNHKWLPAWNHASPRKDKRSHWCNKSQVEIERHGRSHRGVLTFQRYEALVIKWLTKRKSSPLCNNWR